MFQNRENLVLVVLGKFFQLPNVSISQSLFEMLIKNFILFKFRENCVFFPFYYNYILGDIRKPLHFNFVIFSKFISLVSTQILNFSK
jgi:hypothetical protein